MSDTDLNTDEILTHHSHDLHFLGRLERVGCREADLALRLYHEPALVRLMLDDALLAGDSERVAVSLEAGAAPPHIVLTREGKFVTCLGAGMHPGELPVLGWERVCIHVERFDRETQRIAQAVSAVHETSDDFGKRLACSGARLSREKLQHSLIVVPLVHHRLLTASITHCQTLIDSLPVIARIKRPQAELPYLRAHWNALHALGHLLVLTSNEGRRSFESVEPLLARGLDYFEMVPLSVLKIGYGPLGLRALWSIGRAGKLALPTLKRLLQQKKTFRGWAMTATALATVGLRHQRLRAEVLGVLNISHLPEVLRTDDSAGFADIFHVLLRHPGLNGSAGPEERRLAAQTLAAAVLDLLEGKSPRSPQEPPRPDDPLLLPRLANLPFNYEAEPLHLQTLMMGALALAGQPAESLYFPAEHLSAAPEFSPDIVMRLGRKRVSRPVSAPPKPGRNEPCSCGSGKKYKKCCG